MSQVVLPSQPKRHSVTAQSDDQGGITFLFESAFPVWTGSVSVLGAPAAAVFTATVVDEQFGTWTGPSASPTLQAQPQTALTITGTGLVPLTQYVCQWIASSDDQAVAPIVWPGASLAVPPVATQELVSASITSAAFGAHVTYPIEIGDNARYDCRGWAGVRLQFEAVGAGLCRITFTWNDVAKSLGSFCQRQMLVIGSNNVCNVTLPHLGDFLQVRVDALTANCSWQLALTQTTAPLLTWAAGPNANDALLLSGSANVTGSGGNAVLCGPGDTFAGGVTVWIDCSLFTSFAARLQWLNSANTYSNLYTWNASSAPGGIVVANVVVPPMPLRIQVVNNDAGAHNAFANVTADMYRAA